MMNINFLIMCNICLYQIIIRIPELFCTLFVYNTSHYLMIIFVNIFIIMATLNKNIFKKYIQKPLSKDQMIYIYMYTRD